MKIEFTHYARFQEIPCYYNIDSGEIKGRNWIYDLALSFMVWLECKLPSHDGDGFIIAIVKELEPDNLLH